jgi:hypothetical protein
LRPFPERKDDYSGLQGKLFCWPPIKASNPLYASIPVRPSERQRLTYEFEQFTNIARLAYKEDLSVECVLGTGACYRS